LVKSKAINFVQKIGVKTAADIFSIYFGLSRPHPVNDKKILKYSSTPTANEVIFYYVDLLRDEHLGAHGSFGPGSYRLILETCK
jgi:hypothetical protein